MKALRLAGRWVLILAASMLLLGGQGLALARAPGGGFHGGGFGGFHGGGFGGSHGGGFDGGHGGFHGGHGGFRGGPWRGPWHGGYGWGGYGWGAGWWGLGLGVYLTTLPWYYSTFWWDGVPYYYVDNDYYLWDSDAGAYEEVQPPAEVAQQADATPRTAPHLYAYPDKGQTTQQQAKDRLECSRWATAQTGFTPEVNAASAAPQGSGATAVKRQNFLRAEGACLEARGYTVG
jgi:hypothetical protein